MAYNNLQPTDTMAVQRGDNSYQVTVDAVSTNDPALQDSDWFLVNRGANSYKVSKATLTNELGPKGVVVTPTVLRPSDGAGSGEQRPLKTAAITNVEGVGINTKLTLSDSTDLNFLVAGDVVEMGMPADVPYQPISDSILRVESDVLFGDLFSSVLTDRYPDGSQANWSGSWPPTGAFDGKTATKAFANNGYSQFAPTTSIQIQNTISFNTDVYASEGWYIEMRLDGVTQRLPMTGPSYSWLTFDAFAGMTISTSTPLVIQTFTSADGDVRANEYVTGLKVDGTLLLDTGTDLSTLDPAFSDDIDTTLILSGNTDLAYFRPGDAVQATTYTNVKKLILKFYDQSGAGYNDNVYCEALYLDGQLLWDSLEFTGAPQDITTGELITDYVEITGSTSNGTQNIRGWANGKEGGLANNKSTDTGWRPYNHGTGAIIEWNQPLSFNNLTIRLSQGSSTPISGTVELPDGTVVATIDLPKEMSNFDDIVGINSGQVSVVNVDAANNEITVDGGKWKGSANNSGDPAGEDKVTCLSPLKAPTAWTIEDITGNTLTLSHTSPTDNDQVWVANDNQAGTDFYVTGITIIDAPLLTADVELESSQFATFPADVDGLKEIIWNIDGTDQSAGTNNPYKPTGLPLNSLVTVKVKHIGNSLGESDYSDVSKFTTGGSRTLNDYYMTILQNEDLYSEILSELAVPWELGKVYNRNDLVKYNCKIYRAVADSVRVYLPTT